jgi:ATP-dependent protease ClpP protease subunit
MQNRITGFVSSHSHISEERLNELMMETEQLTKDVGSILVGKQAVEEGLINEVGGIHQAITKLHQLIKEIKNTR